MSDHEQLRLLQQEFKEHRKDYYIQIQKLLDCQKANTATITKISESTSDLVKAWEAASGAVKVASVVGRFVKWVAGLAVIGTALTWIVNHLK